VVPRPSEVLLTSRVARRYYLDQRSKTEIADEFGISRFRVARLLEAARRTGMVHIEIRSVDAIDVELSERLRAEWGVPHALVLDVPDDDEVALRRSLGAAAAGLLGELVGPNDVLGMAWARTIEATAAALTAFPPCQVVQLTGALTVPEGGDVIDIVRRVARLGGGRSYVFYAPFVAPDATSARTLRRHADVAQAFSLLPETTVAMVGVGRWAPGRSTIFDAVSPADQQRATRAGVVAELSGVFIDGSGRPVASGLGDQMIGPTAADLRAIHTVLGVGYGVARVEAVRAALTGGWLQGLVTHTSLARVLLSGRKGT
jgi:DNA-binding transcriptional regulator LsrR (DeoR family)